MIISKNENIKNDNLKNYNLENLQDDNLTGSKNSYFWLVVVKYHQKCHNSKSSLSLLLDVNLFKQHLKKAIFWQL